MKSNPFEAFLSAMFLAVSVVAVIGAETQPDQFEAMGWTRLGEVSDFPKEVARETGSQDALPLAQIDQPKISEPNHLVAGMIRYENVAGAAYLEMWTGYENGEKYFSRTLGEFGPMAKLSGSSDWRRVMMPFRGLSDRHPVKLELNAVLPGGGKIEFKEFALYQSAEVHGGGWWAPGQSIAGATVTSIAALILLAFAIALSSMGKGRALALGILWVLFGLGIAAFVGGIVVAITGQSPGAWAPLLACGAIAAIAGGVGLPIVRRAYLKHELRRISAVDRAA